ncbi:MAG: PAS domain-containing protein, partial [Oscillospiraceae bacterium]
MAMQDSREIDSRQLAETYAQAAKQCGVTLWTFDFASRTIYDFNNATHLVAFDGIDSILHVPEVFIADDSSLHPEDRPAFLAMFDRLFAGAKTATSIGRWCNQGQQERWYEISYTSIFDDGGAPCRAIGTAIDITERIRLEERYREELKWRKVHNRDVLGSFQMNLT